MSKAQEGSTVAEGEPGAAHTSSARRPWSRWPAVIPDRHGKAAGRPEGRGRRSILRELPVLLVAAFVIAFVVKSLVAQAFFIPSESMVPTLKVGDRVLVSRLSYRLHEPRRGDVLVFDSPLDEEKDARSLPRKVFDGLFESVGLRQPSTEEFIKRVIALPGETVEGKNGQIYIDDKLLTEPYLPQGSVTKDFSAKKIEEGHLWVMGDNREHSSDSRVFGAIDEDKVVGRAILRIWPLPRLGFL